MSPDTHNNSSSHLISKTIAALVALLPAAAISFILYYSTQGLHPASDAKGELLKALITMSIFGMVAILYFFGIGIITSIIFKHVAQTSYSRWPKNLAYLSASIIWLWGIYTSISLYVGL